MFSIKSKGAINERRFIIIQNKMVHLQCAIVNYKDPHYLSIKYLKNRR